MKKYLVSIFKVLLSGIVSVIILSGFCFVYDYNGSSIVNPTGATDVKRKAYQFTSNMKEGFCFKRADQYGFYNTERAVENEPQILLLGSSHMEADQMRTDENVGAILSEHFEVFNMGLSGNFICPCISRMKEAVETYEPTDYVILETFNCHPELEEIQDVLDDPPVPASEKNPLMEMISTYCPFAVNLFYELENWYAVNEAFPREKTNMEMSSVEEEDGIDYHLKFGQYTKEFDEDFIEKDSYAFHLNKLIEKAAVAVQDGGAELIIFYHPSIEIDRRGELKNPTEKELKEIALMKQVCEKQQVVFVDMTDVLRKLYQDEKQLPNGFHNTAIAKGHLNKHGHRVIANELIRLLEERGL